MTQPVANLQAPLVDKSGKIIPPWNSFFQQFTQSAPAVVNVTQKPYTANTKGVLILTGATAITLTRGNVNINLTGQRIIPISIGDTVTWSGAATAQFLGS